MARLDIQNLGPELFDFASFDLAAGERTGYSNYSYWRATVTKFLQSRQAVIALAILGVLLTFTLIQPFLPGQRDPNLINIDPETFRHVRNVRPGAEFWFGTNSIGQDLWARIWTGTRTSLLIAILVATWNTTLGIIVGAIWGYVRSIDRIMTEIYNVLDNIPTTIVMILLAYMLRPSVTTLIIAMCALGWVGMTRFVRTQVMIIRDREYNLASRCLGTPTGRIITKNILPYLVSVIMLRFALTIPAAIASEVFLSYIGLGLPLHIPSLGNLVNEGRQLMMIPAMRYQLIFPSVVLSLITISFYIIGNAFSDAADPRNHT
ncbi:MAG: ABC transporter permease [Selenomonadales bacterium]|jgi:oligopeptide transport system permease protein|nr:ABC transporter permease [Selenomonadales bacterium]